MSRRARSRLLARELKRGETYLGPDLDADPEEETAPDESSQPHGYECPCCNRQQAQHFWCGICSTGAIESYA